MADTVVALVVVKVLLLLLIWVDLKHQEAWDPFLIPGPFDQMEEVMLVVHEISPIIDIQTLDTDLQCMEDFFLDLHIDEANMVTIEATPPATTTTTTTTTTTATMIMIHTSIESKTVVN